MSGGDFVLKGRVEVDAKAAVDAIGSTTTAVGGLTEAERDSVGAAKAAAQAQAQLDRAQTSAAGSARAQRAGMQQLGLQFGDFTQQVSLGINPVVAFGQQAGQAAYAASQMGGAVGAVGTFLAGPWGAIILAATTVVGGFAYQMLTAGDAADQKAQKLRTLEDAVKDLDAATGASTKNSEEQVRLHREEVLRIAELTVGIRTLAKAKLEAALADAEALRASAQYSGGGDPGAVASGQAVIGRDIEARIAGLKQQIAEANKTIAAGTGAQAGVDLYNSRRAAAAATNAAAAATQKYEREETRLDAALAAHKITIAQHTAGLIEAKRVQETETNAKRDAAAATREAAKEQRQADRDAKAYAKTIDDLAASLAKANSAVGELANTSASPAAVAAFVRDAAGRSAKEREDTGLAASVKMAEAALDNDYATRTGHAIGESFGETSLAFSDAIGRAIGGKLGSKVGGFASLLGADKGAFGGEFKTAFQSSFKQLGEKLDFLPKGLGSVAGKAFAGASQGQFASSIAGAIGIQQSKLGAQIGGALGSYFGPLGSIAGGLIGGTIGGLLKKTKFASATVSGSGGALTTGDATGNNAGYRKAADALGSSVGDAVQAIVQQLGGSIGDFKVSIGQRKGKFVVDGSGSGRTKGGGVQSFGSESEAVQAALADAIRDGAVGGVSPRIQGVLKEYADNVNKAVAEALKVKSIEDLLANRDNPFATAFRDFEYQAKQRLDAATKYGFDVVEIEKITGEERAKLVKDTLDRTVSSAKSLLDDLRYGSRAEGSYASRVAALTTARDAAAAAVRGGDTSQLDKLSQLSGQLLDLQKEGFGSTGAFAASRSDTINLLEGLVQQTQDRIDAASKAAQGVQDKTAPLLTEANGTLDDIYGIGRDTLQAIRDLTAAIGSGGGTTPALAALYARTL